ncbi:MAG: CoB--CoM heterodisulfide reductase iron-sulfur subunit B family protein [Deltaproteobacteria bacterium]|nr:CoB--CoM heterodisulfide reductase iron-sulfur subunit B family protein [Deltaproteobacteria bacterium]
MLPMKIPYYPGCTLNTFAKSFDESARSSALEIGFEMAELKQWNCCGATFPLTPDNLIALSAPAKVLSNAGKEGDTLTTLCSVCYNVLKRTNKVMRDNREKRSTINGFIEEEYDGAVNVLHFLEVLRDKIGFDKVKAAVKRPLTGIKTGAYYGCMLLRPFEDMGIDNAERPTVFENLLKALGAEPVEFPNRIECCGAHLAMNNEEVVTKLSGNVMTSAVGSGAELIVTSCPLCQYNLEKSQDKVASRTPGYTGVPVIYFTQALGLALGQPIETLGFEKNVTDVMPLLKKKGIV